MSIAQDILRLMSDGKERSSLDITLGLYPGLTGCDLRNRKVVIITTLSKMKRRGDIIQTRTEWVPAPNTKVAIRFWRKARWKPHQ